MGVGVIGGLGVYVFRIKAFRIKVLVKVAAGLVRIRFIFNSLLGEILKNKISIFLNFGLNVINISRIYLKSGNIIYFSNRITEIFRILIRYVKFFTYIIVKRIKSFIYILS